MEGSSMTAIQDFRRWLGWVALVATAMLALEVANRAFTTL